MDKTKILTIVSIILFLIVLVIGIFYLKNLIAEMKYLIYSEGFNEGVAQTINYIGITASKCQPVNLILDNKILTLKAVGC